MVKVLEITASAGYGGGPQHVFELVSYLGEEVLIDIACPRQEPYWDRFSAVVQGELVEIPERRFTMTAALRLVRHVRRKGIDLLHSHGKGAGVYGRFVAALTGIPLVHTPHGIHLDHYGKFMRGVYIGYERMTGRFADCTIFVSESEKKRAIDLHLWPSVQSQVIVNGVRGWPDDQAGQWRCELRRSLGVTNTELVVITLSRFDFSKNMKEMVSISEKCPGIRFWFVGDGADKTAVMEFCKSRKLNNVWLPGFVPDPVRYLAAADVYLSTSRWEALPLAILEAMSLAKPVVASEVTGNRDVVHDSITGYLYPLGDVDKAVELLGRLEDDKELCQSMGKAAKRCQKENFSVETMGSKTFTVYRNVLDGKLGI